MRHGTGPRGQPPQKQKQKQHTPPLRFVVSFCFAQSNNNGRCFCSRAFELVASGHARRRRRRRHRQRILMPPSFVVFFTKLHR
uniref:Uncharacterized protein n=1 Tax=Caenorhabditis japonica TaxID=281687 RepID=A0A8R1IJG8_CAEJA